MAHVIKELETGHLFCSISCLEGAGYRAENAEEIMLDSFDYQEDLRCETCGEPLNGPIKNR